MEKSICFRDFEERDIDFIYKCKNDEKLNSFIVGQWHPFTYEEATKWVHGCMGEHENYKFWAVCTNDKEQKIIGWVSLSHIDRVNRNVCFHGIVIGDKDYQDGTAWIESYQLIFEKAFLDMGFDSLYGSHLSIHPASGIIANSMFMSEDGIEHNAVEKDGELIDLVKVSIDKETYMKHLEKGEYEFGQIQKRILNYYRQNKK